MTDHANPNTMPATLHAAGSPPVELPMSIADRATPPSNAVEVHQVRFRYGKKTALDALDLSIPTGITYGLFGANGAGKSTLLRLLAGVERPQRGHVAVLGHDVRALPLAVRQQIGYVAEGQQVPAWMRLSQLLAYCAPLYPAWDHALAADLQAQFALDPQQKIGGMSRGQRMKVALLCALAARPRVLFMDEPFTGLDVSVKDELVRGLLDSALAQQTTVVLATHDILEVESLVEQVGFLRHGRMSESGNLEQLRERYRSLEFTFARAEDVPSRWPAEFTTLAPVERSGLRVLVHADMSRVRHELPAFASRAQQLHDRALTLRELYFLFATAQGTGTEDCA